MPQVKYFNSDVLIIGGGLAALRAAISARSHGRSVLMVVKGKLGLSGSSVLTDGGYAAVSNVESSDSIRSHVEDTLESGAHLADVALTSCLCEEAYDRLRDMESMGAQFLWEDEGRRTLPSGDHRFPRVFIARHQTGRDLTSPMASYCRTIGVEVLESTMAVSLLESNESIVGGVCIDLRGGNLIMIQASSTVLATGGLGRMFSITSNPNDVTGDGLALAWRAGALLRDMEFIQFYPWRLLSPNFGHRMLVQPSTFAMGGKLYNRRGDAFMEHYAPIERDRAHRDVVAWAIADQIRSDLGIDGGVRIDFSNLTDAEMKLSNPGLWDMISQKRVDWRREKWIVAPEAHYLMGGIAVNARGESSKRGLFAAGEVTGGVHGANRLDSNALPDTQVFGHRAGIAAAEYVDLAKPVHPSLIESEVSRWEAVLQKRLATTGQPDCLDEKRAFSEQMDRSLGLIREKTLIQSGLEFLDKSTESIASITVSSLMALRQIIELEFLQDTAKLCLLAAMTRTESRGAHYRLDFPQRDEQQNASLFIARRDDGTSVCHP